MIFPGRRICADAAARFGRGELRIAGDGLNSSLYCFDFEHYAA